MKLSFVHIILFSAFILIFNSGKWGVIETSEARYAEISREMMVHHDYVNPTLLDVHHYHKPPITYYITVLGFKIFGVNAFGARFFLQMAILIQLILIYKITYLLFGNKTIALMSVLIYFSMPLVLISSRNLTTDAYLNTFILASLYFWLTYKIKNHKPLLLYLFYLSLGLIFETKGPVGLIFPLFFITSYKLIYKDHIEKNVHQFFGFLLFLIVSSAWYIVLIIDNSEFWNYFIHHQLKNRIISNSFHRGKPFWYYLVTVPLLGFPWVFVLLVYLKSNFIKIVTDNKVLMVLYATTISIFVVFSLFHTKLILYVLPAFGYIAMISAYIISKLSQKSLKIINHTLIITCNLFLISILSINIIDVGYHFNFTLAITISLLFIIFYFVISEYTTGQLKTATLSFLFGSLLLIVGNIILTENEDQLNSTKHAMSFVNNQLDSIENIVVYNYLMPSVKFYSNKNTITLNDGHNTVAREVQFQKNSNYKNYLLDLKTEKGRQQTDSILKQGSVLISRKKDHLPNYLDFLNHSPYEKKEFGKWVIYY